MSVVLPVAAQTRPLLTEEATTPAAGTLVFETGADFVHAEPNFQTGLPRDRWDLPLLRLVYSPADNVEMDVEWVGWIATPADPTYGGVSDFGDVTLRAKVRLAGGRRLGPVLGARFTVTLPETTFGVGLGPNVLRMSAQLLWSRSFGSLAVHANAGLLIHDEVLLPHEQQDFVAYGLAATRRVSRRLEIVAEIAGRAGKGAPGAEARAEARAGFRYGAGRLVWDAALRRGLAQADGTWGLTLGAGWTMKGRR